MGRVTDTHDPCVMSSRHVFDLQRRRIVFLILNVWGLMVQKYQVTVTHIECISLSEVNITPRSKDCHINQYRTSNANLRVPTKMLKRRSEHLWIFVHVLSRIIQ